MRVLTALEPGFVTVEVAVATDEVTVFVCVASRDEQAEDSIAGTWRSSGGKCRARFAGEFVYTVVTGSIVEAVLARRQPKEKRQEFRVSCGIHSTCLEDIIGICDRKVSTLLPRVPSSLEKHEPISVYVEVDTMVFVDVLVFLTVPPSAVCLAVEVDGGSDFVVAFVTVTFTVVVSAYTGLWI